MSKIQFTLTVEEGKQMIANGVARHFLTDRSLKRGKVVLKGGTTVSKIAEILIGKALRICGRITGRGTVANLINTDGPHTVLIEKGECKNIDDCVAEEMQGLGPHDLIICGANAIDGEGRAALMAGSPGGGNIGRALSSWYSEGIPILIPVGIEKLIPGSLEEIIGLTGRKGKDLSWGMSVGLMPIQGEVITEIEAVKYLADVECYAIGAGGIDDGQGSITLEARGEDAEIEKLIEIVKSVKDRDCGVSGIKQSLVQCEAPCASCARHIGCGYKSGRLGEERREQ